MAHSVNNPDFISVFTLQDSPLTLQQVISERAAVLSLLKQLILTELYKMNFDILDTVFDSNLGFDDNLSVYQSTLLQVSN